VSDEYPIMFCPACGGTLIEQVCSQCGDRSTINDEEGDDDSDE